MEALVGGWNAPLVSLGLLVGALLLGLVLHYAVFSALQSITRRVPSVLIFQGVLLHRSRQPTRMLLPLLIVVAFLPLIERGLPVELVGVLESGLYLLIVAAVAWLLVQLAYVLEDVVVMRYNVETVDNLHARKVITQTRILRRILVVAILVVAVAIMLLQYERFQRIGAGILASAGIAGIIVGFAAQRTLGNLFAGFQIAITQPIRVDDVVIVEGDFGWVEEITLTYVVVRYWDLRRIVLPISYFIEKPFQNWTRTSSELLGTVFLYVDYTVPFEAVRQELQRIVEASDRWDGRACVLQVTDATERTVQLRALVSAASAPRLFDLRCEVREQLLVFIRRHYPEALPTLRIYDIPRQRALSDEAGG